MDSKIIERFGEVAAKAGDFIAVEGELQGLTHCDADEGLMADARARRDAEATEFLQEAARLAKWMTSDRPAHMTWSDEHLDLGAYKEKTLTVAEAQEIIRNFAKFIAEIVKFTPPLSRATPRTLVRAS